MVLPRIRELRGAEQVLAAGGFTLLSGILRLEEMLFSTPEVPLRRRTQELGRADPHQHIFRRLASLVATHASRCHVV